MKDISDDCSFENSKSLPGGWSQHEIHYKGNRIGWFESGYPCDFDKGYSFEVKSENIGDKKVNRLIVYKDSKE